jgi:single-strand DNA-binding protein|tara:strand:+ start:1419 stop:1886 length:468 start_codon:yes stop_codon:yes gene_type:complete
LVFYIFDKENFKMSGSLNKVMLIGNLGDEVKMHHFDGGGCIGRFPIATNESYTNKATGEKVSNTEWHNLVVKNKAAEVCEKYLKKGDKIYVEGKIKTRKWQSEDGIQRYSTEIHVAEFNFLSTKSDSNSDSSLKNDKDHQSESVNEDNQADDLPF